VANNVEQELQVGRIKMVTMSPLAFVVSPLGAAPKMANGVQTGWRRIHDPSPPNGSSVNDGIPPEFGSLVYQIIHDAVVLIARHGKGVKLHKRDLKDAFRKFPVSPYDYWLLLVIGDYIPGTWTYSFCSGFAQLHFFSTCSPKAFIGFLKIYSIDPWNITLTTSSLLAG
jgi:hypothetical protein